MVCVVSNTCKRLMPTTEYKARKLMEKGCAKIYQYDPFTIIILDREDGYTQSIELKCDTGDKHIGMSICSEKHEYVSVEVNPLKDEKEKHNDQKKYRRTRRNRKRYRSPRFNNRKRKEGWLAPSLEHKVEIHKHWIEKYLKVMPIEKVILETGTFDTQRLKAINDGKTLPVGTDYQCGEQYDFYTMRDAVFSRDHYTCQCCKKSMNTNKNMVLRTHHIGYWKGDRSNRVSNLLTVCDKCHTQVNHQPSGKLYGLQPKSKKLPEAAFMNSVRYILVDEIYNLQEKLNVSFEVEITYGSMTKLKRKELGIEKSHVNDAYVMGEFHPKHRCKTEQYQKKRRNNRILSKFYDAKYIDSRDNSIKTGKELSSGRTNRNHKRDSENLHQYRKQKVTKGKTTIRKNHYPFQPKDIVLYDGKKYKVNGTNNKEKSVQLYIEERVSIEEITLSKKKKNMQTEEIECGDKVTYEKKTYTVKKVIDTKHVLLSGLISTKPENLKHLKYSNEYDRVEII